MKPIYSVPSMEEIAAIPWNGLIAASTFSGAGGSCLGYKLSGFRVVYANEFIPAAQDTYTANFPDTYLDRRDIRDVKGSEILEKIGISAGELDLFDGSPPCASFSTSGKREKYWGKEKKYSDTIQRVDDLFFEYIRLLGEIQPKVFVAENVSGLVKGKAKGYFLEILPALKAAGYNVKARVLNAEWLGVPQSRERLIFIGVRSDLGMDPVFPQPLDYYYTVREAWKGIEHESGQSFDGYAKYNKYFECNDRGNHPTAINLKRLRWGEPANSICQTIGKGAAALAHPDIPAHPSILQLKRLSSFPDDFILTGDYYQQWERIGRAVPPLMMKAIAGAIRDGILCKH